MRERLRPLVWPLVLLALAALAFRLRIHREMADFEVYRTAAIRALAGQPLYRADDVLPFKYLPAFALGMTPFALIDDDGARAIWFALSAGLLTAFLRWSVTALPERRRPATVVLWITVPLMAKFYAHELLLGQVNIFLGVLIVGALLAVQIDQPIIGGLALGAAAFVKPYALLLLPWLAFTYGLGAAAAGLGVLAVGLLFPVVIYGWNGNTRLLVAWAHQVTGATNGVLLGADNVSFAAMWAKWVGVGSTAATLATLTTVAALGLVAIVWVRRQRVGNPDYLECSLLMLLVPLLSPQGWDYVLLLGTPAVMCLVDRWSEVGRGWQAATAAALALMGLTIFDVMGRALYARFMALSIVTVAAIWTAIALTHLRWAQKA